ncbi:MAG: hypothetical protein Q8Q31_02345 [Nanoarchaeota archaeon]|nr:hypothetical protein [Nanoarchaeota archaeon]
MEKRGEFLKIFLISIIIVLILVVAALLVYVFVIKGKDNSSIYTELEKSGKLVNPVLGMSDEDAIQQFNETFVYYLLYKIKAYNLHNPPASSDTPKIEFSIEGDNYNAEVIKGRIDVRKGEIPNEDILIWTSKKEAIQMLKDSSSIVDSFSAGDSNVEPRSKETTLFLKGYLKLYEDLTGAKLI